MIGQYRTAFRYIVPRWKWLIALLSLVLLSESAALLPFGRWMGPLNDRIALAGPFGLVLFALVYAAGTLLFVPGSVLTVAAGLVFGVVRGTIAAWLGALLGASLAFLIGRYLARAKVEAMAKRSVQFRALDDAFGQQGWKLVGLLRLSPLVPFNVSNYFYGITKVRFLSYVAASAVGMMPGTIVYAYVGAIGRARLEGARGGRSALDIAFFGLGFLGTVGVSIWMNRIARRALEESGAARARCE